MCVVREENKPDLNKVITYSYGDQKKLYKECLKNENTTE